MNIIKESMATAAKGEARWRRGRCFSVPGGPDYCEPILTRGCKFRGSQSHRISQGDAQRGSQQQQGQERAPEKQEAQRPQETLAGETKCV